MVIEQEIEIPMAAGICDGLFYRPEGDGSWPGVIHLTDAGGIRASHRDMARRLAAEGFAVLMPNLFYRTATPPVVKVEFKAGAPSEAMMKRVGELSAPLTPEAIEEDASAYITFLSGKYGVRADAPMGVVGYCLSGAIAMRIAAARPDKIVAAASFHGGRLLTDAPTSPHLLLPRIQARLYFAHAIEDSSMPMEAIEQFDQALNAWGGEFETEVYDGAYHNWTVADSPVYNEAQAERAFQKLVDFFTNALR